jgi:hypothetical protein
MLTNFTSYVVYSTPCAAAFLDFFSHRCSRTHFIALASPVPVTRIYVTPSSTVLFIGSKTPPPHHADRLQHPHVGGGGTRPRYLQNRTLSLPLFALATSKMSNYSQGPLTTELGPPPILCGTLPSTTILTTSTLRNINLASPPSNGLQLQERNKNVNMAAGQTTSDEQPILSIAEVANLRSSCLLAGRLSGAMNGCIKWSSARRRRGSSLNSNYDFCAVLRQEHDITIDLVAVVKSWERVVYRGLNNIGSLLLLYVSGSVDDDCVKTKFKS